MYSQFSYQSQKLHPHLKVTLRYLQVCLSFFIHQTNLNPFHIQLNKEKRDFDSCFESYPLILFLNIDMFLSCDDGYVDWYHWGASICHDLLYQFSSLVCCIIRMRGCGMLATEVTTVWWSSVCPMEQMWITRIRSEWVIVIITVYWWKWSFHINIVIIDHGSCSVHICIIIPSTCKRGWDMVIRRRVSLCV